MAARRPLVRHSGGNRQLPPGDTLLGVPAYLPAYQVSGTMLKLALNLDYSLTVAQAGGGSLSVQVVING